MWYFQSIRILFVLALAAGDLSAAEQDGKTILLWPDGAPNAKGAEDLDRPALTIHLPPADKANGAAVIVAPGGGYHALAIDHEGQQVAKWFNSFGVAAFVLKYRLKPAYTPADALLDGKRAMRYVRAHAQELGVAPKRIGMLGFSAGAHLSSCVAIDSDAGDANAVDAIEKQSSRPDFICLIYGGTTSLGDLSQAKSEPAPATKTFAKGAPPAFLFATAQDKWGDKGVEVYQALRALGVDAEIHVFGGWGPHGLGLAAGDPGPGAWPNLAQTWMRRLNLLSDAERVAVSGKIMVDGKPLNRGWITLIPVDAPHKPFAAAYLGHGNKGEFKIAAKDGPVAGAYRIELVQEALEFSAKPTLPDAVRITRKSPGDAAPLTCEIKTGENVLSVEVSTK